MVKESDNDRSSTPSTSPRSDITTPITRRPLRPELSSTLTNLENDSWSSIYDGTAPETTDTNIRYAAYASRVRTILLSAHRYVAYTSDIGESFRPVAHPWLVSGAYAVSWLYLAGDVGLEGWKAWRRNQRIIHPERYAEDIKHGLEVKEGMGEIVTGVKRRVGDRLRVIQEGDEKSSLEVTRGKVVPIEDYRSVMAQRAVFQSVASMGLPAFTIHSLVKYSGRAMKNVKNVRIRTWGPIGLGLAAVPALPYMFDEPVEKATEYIFHKGFEFFGGPAAVGHTPETGREKLLQVENRIAKDKEL